jgi:Icc-related predicted phosphoesterase
MPFWSRKSTTSARRLRLFFATDVHGSEPTFRKFINAGKFYQVDVLVLGGDITGKMLVPIIHTGLTASNPADALDSASPSRRSYRATLQSRTVALSEEELPEFESRLAKLGFYRRILSEQEYTRLTADPDAVHEIYLEEARQRLASWIRLAEERLQGSGIRCFVTGGNDDPPEVLSVIDQEARECVVPCEDRIIQLDDEGHGMASLGYSNLTPWNTPREISEEELTEHITRALQGMSDFTRAIFNFHVPPVDSTLDLCPKLDTSTDPPTVVTSGGEPVMFGAGSQAVRAAIEKYQPLLSLHGHIHESRNVIRIGRTTAINPGSEYGEGVLRGVIVSISGDQVESTQMTSG